MSTGMWVAVGVALVVLFLLKQMGQAKPAEVREALARGAKVIDVRTEAEFRGGHVKGAINLPLGELEERIARASPDKEVPLLLYCASGTRSGMGQKRLQALGYRTVLNLGSHGRAAGLVGR